MPSLRARLINLFLRLTTRRQWKSDLQITPTRSHAARMDERLGRGAPPVHMESVNANGVPATWIGAPELAHTGGVLLYLHGGAFVLHLPKIYQRLATSLSALTGMRVLLVDYRLAPEHPFPAGVDDCFAAYRWLAQHGHTKRAFAIAGDSAGGNLTLVTLMQARDAGLPLPNCGVALSPVADLTFSGASTEYNADFDPMFSRAADELMPKWYCPGADRSDPRLSPLFGRWEGLPPLLFHAGSTELLLDDSIRAQDRARVAGVDARIRVWPHLPHVFHIFSLIPEHRAGLAEVAGFITGYCARPPGDTTT